MKNLLVILFVVIITTISFSQGVHTFTLAAGDTLTSVISLSDKEIPTALFCDSLTADATISFYLWFGDTTGVAKSNWYQVTAAQTNTASTTTLTQKKYTPLTSTIFDAVKSYLYSTMTGSGKVWVMLDFAATQTNAKIIKMMAAVK